MTWLVFAKPSSERGSNAVAKLYLVVELKEEEEKLRK